MKGEPVRAALFDLDGTLIDSEVHTDTAIRVIGERHGVAGLVLPHTETRGRTWGHIAGVMRLSGDIAVNAGELADELLRYWVEIATDVTPVPGAPEALREASRRLKLGVVSSSPRAVIDEFLERLGVDDCIDRNARIGGDAVRASKPDPDGYLMGARALGVAPAASVVFEDSQAGLLAAQAAGMRSMFITCCAADIPGNTALASASARDYLALPPKFWARLADGSLELAGQVYA
jgi:HAD superfamily hydrolase (TIGR01509 family)